MAGGSLKRACLTWWSSRSVRDPWVPEEGPQRLSSGHHMHTHTQTPTHEHIHTDHNCQPLLTSRAVFWAIQTVKVFAGFKIALLGEHPLSISMLQRGEMGLRDLWSMILGWGSSHPRGHSRGSSTSFPSNKGSRYPNGNPPQLRHNLRESAGTCCLWNSQATISRLAPVPTWSRTSAGGRKAGNESPFSSHCGGEAAIAGSSSGAPGPGKGSG